MKISLYEAAAELREILENVDAETGELPPEYDQARALVATKSQAVAAWILENNAQADLVEAHAKALMDRVKAARKRSEWLKGYLCSHMAAAGVLSIKSDDGTFSATLSPGRDESIDIYEASSLPEDYMREKVEVKPDKELIKKAIKDGFTVPGARLVAKDRLTIK